LRDRIYHWIGRRKHKIWTPATRGVHDLGDINAPCGAAPCVSLQAVEDGVGGWIIYHHTISTLAIFISKT
jgi:hypothetical protein